MVELIKSSFWYLFILIACVRKVGVSDYDRMGLCEGGGLSEIP